MNRAEARCTRPSRWPVVRAKRISWTLGVPNSAKESFILSGLKRIPKFEVKFMVPFLRRALFCAVVTIPFIGSLSGHRGSSGHSLFRVRRNGTDVQYVERIEAGYRIRDLAQMPDGRIALLSDDGRVHFLSRLHYAYCDELVRPGEEACAIDCNSGG